jgi:hypothetical protein
MTSKTKECFEIKNDGTNRDIPSGMNVHEARQYYLDMYGEGFQSKMPDPMTFMQPYEDKWVFRADLAPAGFKAFAAEKVIAECEKDVLVYVAPRVGHAPHAIAVLAQLYGKRCVFFAPASKEASNHQAVTLAYGADLRFLRSPAMPTINIWAKKWAEDNDAQYLPFGLSGMPAVTAGIVKLASRIPEPPEFWCATSTGTMIRGLQIGWPNAVPNTVAVSRNIKPGEVGRAVIESATVPFLKPCKVLPEFPTTATYDAKAWAKFKEFAKPGAIFINVGSDSAIESELGSVDRQSINSARVWGDTKDLAPLVK